MADPSYGDIAERVDPTAMIWVIEDSLTHAAIAKLCNACALSYDGTRTRSVSTRRLTQDLVEAVYKDGTNAKTVIKALRRANTALMRQIGRLSAEEIQALLEKESGETRNGKMGRLLFALAADERPEINDLAEDAIEFLYEREEDRAYEVLESEEEDDPLLAEMLDKNERLTREAEHLRATIGDLERERAEDEQKIRRFVDERRSLQTKIAEIQRELGAAQRTIKELKEKNVRLQERRERTKEADTAPLTSSLNQLIRDNRKLHHHLEQTIERMGKQESPEPFVEALGETISEIKHILADQAAEDAQGRTDLGKRLEEIREEARGVQTELRKLQDMGLRSLPRPRGDIERVGIFVDVQNIFYAAKQFGARLDFEKLLEYAVGNRRLVRAIAYIVRSPEVDQSGFIAMLQQKSYEVKQKDLRLRSDGSAKGDWDMGMAIDIIGLADKLDVVVLVSGDGDFVALAHLIKTIGPTIEVFSFPHNTARDLMQVADQYYPIEEAMLLRTSETDRP